jgi:hypothetical protein
MATEYEYLQQIEIILDTALNRLSAQSFEKLLDDISMILSDYEE